VLFGNRSRERSRRDADDHDPLARESVAAGAFQISSGEIGMPGGRRPLVETGDHSAGW
jgi:hypothetical protein